ncbi:diguanylate cyclase [Alkalibacterium putridalgicola]|uniref:diguanylate cyclase domain-containing protein n=1 Tax=Alkalibacterium putridalgicola TaxID=426703 RepID=UPI0034CE18B4
MLAKHKNKIVLVFIFIYTFFYYGWITIFQTHEYIRTLGGNLFSIAGPLLATIWLAQAYKKNRDKDKLFWLFLSFGTFSFVIAEVLWFIYETVLLFDVPYPGSPDIFYILNIIFYLMAFSYKLKMEKKYLSITKFIFDIFLVMTVYTTFFWYFLIKPLIANDTVTPFELALSLFYPLGDLTLLFFIVILFMTGRRLFHRYTTVFLFSGVLVQITADIGFLLMQNTDSYVSGSFLDPLFVLGLMLIGFTGLLQKEPFSEETSNLLLNESDSRLRMLFPYIYVSILFIYMVVNASTLNEVTFGAGVTIAVIIVRQLLVLVENKRLIKDYQRQTTDLILSEERHKSLFYHHPDAVFSLDLKGHVLSVNEKGEDLLGVKREKLISQSIMHFVDDAYKEKARETFYNTKKGISQHYEFPLTNHFGRLVYINVTHIPIMIKTEMVGVFSIAQDITQNKRNEERIHYMAYHDTLTDLANRTHFEGNLNKQIRQSEKTGEPFAVIFMDLDNFKHINDTYGHATGDELLSEVGYRLRLILNDVEHGARLGGDEFTLLLTGISSRNDISSRIQELSDALSHPYQIKDKKLTCIPSIGYSLFPEDGTTAAALLKCADDAMYANKRQSKQH